MKDELERYRDKVDEIDDAMVKAITERIKICMAIGLVKKKRGLPVKNAARENEVYSKVKQKAADCGLDPQQVEAVFREIVNMCSAVQE